MMRAFHTMIERRLRRAEAEGKLSNLEGEGRPLPDRSSEASLDPSLAAGMRVMAEAGGIPEEFELRKARDAAQVEWEAEWRAETDPARRKALMGRIADLEMRYAMARDARRQFMR